MIRRLNFGFDSVNCAPRGWFVVFASLFTLFCSCFLFSHSAYATVTNGSADFIYISSSGNASFGKVNPNSSGSIATAQDTLSVSTNCSAGFNIYISAVNGSATGTSLINNASDSNNEIITLTGTTVGTTAKALENNTWGFNTINNNTYYGLPAHANAMNNILYSGTNTTIPIYYGAKVTNTLVPGKYTGQVLYTATVNSACLNYTVVFDKNANDATGSMSNQTMTPSVSTALTANGFSRSGYVFLGWSTDQNATTPTYTDGQSVTGITTGGNTITLYAIWGRTMQDWATNFGCAALAMNNYLTLYDARDKNPYTVKKLADKKCWMVENLAIGGNSPIELNSSNTHMPDGVTYYLPANGTMNTKDASTSGGALPVDFANNSSYYQYFKVAVRNAGDPGDSDSSGTLLQKTGYYDFVTATLGSDWMGNKSVGSSTNQDICPKGWRLPYITAAATETSGTRDFTGDFSALANIYNPNATWENDITLSRITYDETIFNNMVYSSNSGSLNPKSTNNSALGLIGSGSYSGSSLSNVGQGVLYIIGSAYTNYYNSLVAGTVSTHRMTPQNESQKIYGYPIRCIAQTADATGYMQDFNASSLNTNEYTVLQDKRDRSEYAVKKLADGKVWMVENLKLTNYKLTPTDSNVASDFDLTTLDQSGSSDWCTTSNTTCYNKKSVYYDPSTRSSYGALYNYYTVTAGESTSYTTGSTYHDICPKGWRLPTGSNYGEINNLYTVWGSSNAYSIFTGDYTTSNYGGYSSLPGYINGSLTSTDSNGYWWSATSSSTSYGFSLGLTDSVSPNATAYRYRGYSVRCVVKPAIEDCTGAMTPGASADTACKMQDGHLWAYGNNGATIAHNTFCPDGVNCNNSAKYCPAGFTIPSQSTVQALIDIQGASNLYPIMTKRYGTEWQWIDNAVSNGWVTGVYTGGGTFQFGGLNYEYMRSGEIICRK